MSRLRTKAQELGVRPGIMTRQTRRALARVRRILEDEAARWADVDGAVTAEIEGLYQRLDDINAALYEAVDQLNEPWGADA